MTDSYEDPKKKMSDNAETFVEGVDFYFEKGLMVLTRRFLLNRGFCCANGCRHCPYEPEKDQGLK